VYFEKSAYDLIVMWGFLTTNRAWDIQIQKDTVRFLLLPCKEYWNLISTSTLFYFPCFSFYLKKDKHFSSSLENVNWSLTYPTDLFKRRQYFQVLHLQKCQITRNITEK